ncbi:type II secretion system protein M (plasmid) [Skermanella mucosa]|uniref:type II secretion system protein GspM n=1 Tax=Skermanella mucosa TaxID=1789672 RepID=UPI00192BEBDF|nr:type II secretion system protein GspM [Skermanella mucosa]UEM24400.1 type II secretion system protein M [Skermanella mucosa]
MNLRFDRIIGRVAAISLVGAIVGTVYVTAVAMPLARQERNAEQIANLQAMLARYRGMAVEVPRIRAAVENFDREPEGTGSYLEGSTDALAAAWLVEQVKRGVQENGGRVNAAQNLPTATVEDLQKVSVRIQFTGGIETLQRVLHAVERGRPMLFIEGMEIRETARSQAGQELNNDPVLAIRLDVAGYLRGRAGK